MPFFFFFSFFGSFMFGSKKCFFSYNSALYSIMKLDCVLESFFSDFQNGKHIVFKKTNNYKK